LQYGWDFAIAIYANLAIVAILAIANTLAIAATLAKKKSEHQCPTAHSLVPKEYAQDVAKQALSPDCFSHGGWQSNEEHPKEQIVVRADTLWKGREC
jgi:hypothetical protein